MGAPAAVTALANTRTGRKAVTAVLLCLALLVTVIVAPLVMVPLALAGSTTADLTIKAGTTDGALPTVVGEWGYPLAGPYSTGRGFGYHPVKDCAICPANHFGYDMDQPCGAPIYAAGPGRVINAGPMPGWGNTVRIDHGGGVVTLYGHMQWESLLVSVGQQVTAGTTLGLEGSTGKSSGCHLHYEVQVRGVAIDPEPFMATLGLPLR